MLYIHFETSEEIRVLTDDEAYATVRENQNKIEIVLLNKDIIFFTSYALYLKNHIIGNYKIQQIIENMEKTLNNLSLENSLKVVLYFCEILFELSKETVSKFKLKTTTDSVAIIPENLKKVVLYIQQDNYRKISVSELAKYCNISQSQMTRYFKDFFTKHPYNISTNTSLIVQNIC